MSFSKNWKPLFEIRVKASSLQRTVNNTTGHRGVKKSPKYFSNEETAISYICTKPVATRTSVIMLDAATSAISEFPRAWDDILSSVPTMNRSICRDSKKSRCDTQDLLPALLRERFQRSRVRRPRREFFQGHPCRECLVAAT
jgi:hypothetical protein